MKLKGLNRKQIIKKKRDELIAKVYYRGDFLLEEVAEMFKLSIGRIGQIIKKYEKKV